MLLGENFDRHKTLGFYPDGSVAVFPAALQARVQGQPSPGLYHTREELRPYLRLHETSDEHCLEHVVVACKTNTPGECTERNISTTTLPYPPVYTTHLPRHKTKNFENWGCTCTGARKYLLDTHNDSGPTRCCGESGPTSWCTPVGRYGFIT